MSHEYIIEVDGLKKHFPLRNGLFGQETGQLRAVDGVSFNIRPGTIFGLVGESGSGKTTVGRTLLGLYDKTAGSVKYRGQELQDLTPKQMRALRPKIQLVFQDPYSSLNPRKRIGRFGLEPALRRAIAFDRDADEIVVAGIPDVQIDVRNAGSDIDQVRFLHSRDRRQYRRIACPCSGRANSSHCNGPCGRRHPRKQTRPRHGGSRTHGSSICWMRSRLASNSAWRWSFISHNAMKMRSRRCCSADW